MHTSEGHRRLHRLDIATSPAARLQAYSHSRICGSACSHNHVHAPNKHHPHDIYIDNTKRHVSCALQLTGHGFGNVGDDRNFLDIQAAVPFAANVSGATPVEGPTLSINMAAQAEAAGLFAPCSRSGSLQAQVVRQGVVSQGGAQPLGLVFPALAVGRAGELLVTFSYAGPGDVNKGKPAYLGRYWLTLVACIFNRSCIARPPPCPKPLILLTQPVCFFALLQVWAQPLYNQPTTAAAWLCCNQAGALSSQRLWRVVLCHPLVDGLSCLWQLYKVVQEFCLPQPIMPHCLLQRAAL